MKSLITTTDYVLIAVGIFTLVIYGLGFVILAVAAWRIGTRMEKIANKQEALNSEEDGTETGEEIVDHLIDETYKCDEYAPRVLEDGK